MPFQCELDSVKNNMMQMIPCSEFNLMVGIHKDCGPKALTCASSLYILAH